MFRSPSPPPLSAQVFSAQASSLTPVSAADNRLYQRLEAAEKHGHQAGRLLSLYSLVNEALVLCEARLPEVLSAAGPVDARAAALHLMAAGGKRIRPLLLALSARACQPAGATALSPGPLAALMVAAELTHAATLLHDDVLDVSEVRRGQETARMRWGNSVSVLAGDFVLIRALEEVQRSAIPGAMPALLSTIHAMIAGEALQLSLRGRGDVTISDYQEVVAGKTAALFAFCGRAGALCAGAAAGPEGAPATPLYAEVLADYARHLGQAFQIVDDVLDIDGEPAELGKAVLSDLREGKLTLPILLALESRPELREHIQHAQLSLDDDSLPEPTVALLRSALHHSEATRQARQQAAAEAEQGCAGLDALPPGPYRDALWQGRRRAGPAQPLAHCYPPPSAPSGKYKSSISWPELR